MVSENRKAIAREAEILMRRDGLTQGQVGERYGISSSAVAGCIRDYREYLKSHAAHDSNVTETYQSVTKPLLQFPSPTVIKRPENDGTDLASWESERDKLLSQNDFVRVMHMNDLHLPYHDTAALSLWFEIAKRFNPQVVVVGSDMLDLPTISRFEPDHDISVDDWQENSREFYWPLVNQLNRLLPNALLVWIYGNHEHRALEAIKRSDSPKVGMAHFIETIRCGGRVLHIGRTEHVEIGGLVVAHGNKAGKYAADKIGAYWPTKTVNFGHIHKHQALGNGFSNGMLGQTIAHYSDWGYVSTQEQGTSTMTVDTLPFGGVSWSYHNFVQANNGLWTQYGDSILRIEQAKSLENAA